MSGRARQQKTDSRRGVRILALALALALALVAAACSSSESETFMLGSDDGADTGSENSIETADGAGDEADAEVGEPVSFSFDDFDGASIDFAEFAADGPVVLNFFAAWCATCVAELPDFETVSQNFEGEVQFLGLSFQERPEHSLALLEETGVTFQTGLDTNGGIFSLFGGLGMPTTVFIDADGQVVNVHSGVLTEDSLTEAIETDLLP